MAEVHAEKGKMLAPFTDERVAELPNYRLFRLDQKDRELVNKGLRWVAPDAAQICASAVLGLAPPESLALAAIGLYGKGG